MWLKSNRMIRLSDICSSKSSILLIGLLLFFTSCDDKKVELSTDTVSSVTYEFYDSSVPPEYHRSYEIELFVEEGSVSVNVHSYGDILHNESFDYSNGQESTLFDLLNKIDPAFKIEEGNSCSGGTGEMLRIAMKDGTSHSMYIDHCDHDDFPKSCGDVKAVINHLKEMIPNLDEFLQ